MPNHPTLGDVDSAEALARYQEAKRAHKAKLRAAGVKYTDRVLAYVTRERDGRKELLVFDHRDHPSAGTQVPAGRLEPGEQIEAGLLRELDEEAGLTNARVVRKFGTFGPHELPHGQAVHEPRLRARSAGRSRRLGARRRRRRGRRRTRLPYRWVPLEPAPELWGGTDPVLAQL